MQCMQQNQDLTAQETRLLHHLQQLARAHGTNGLTTSFHHDASNDIAPGYARMSTALGLRSV